ncbi:rab11 family-interacting protein 1 [Hyperolius riggenbachi]|uniref:rab11 family-interacting protein 1 n=1 Tax=Hyperolius riggenbachi TaxID=752182 RepID=UPI0035A2B0F7
MSLAQQSQTWFPTHVQVTVLQAKGLRSKGKAGTNDAYAIIQLGKEKYSTTVSEKSVAPVWKEEATFEVPLLHNDNQERCTVRVIVMHRALVGMDKFLGQVDLNLWDLHQTRNRRKVQWYPLKSKPGKKEKDRGQIEVEVEFMRNNMTASMFDLSMKEKSRSPFGKLKDKIKGKRQDGLPDTASAIVPSMNQYGDDSDEEIPEVDKKKSKLKTLFSKPGLKKNSLSQSMSVLPTLPPSPSQRTVLRPGEFSSDFNQSSGSPVSERRFPHLPVIKTHKRTVSEDTKQWSQAAPGNKKDASSLFSGLRPKNDPITRSNLCINGNHVYMEESEPKSDSSKENSLNNSPQIFRKSPNLASTENLAFKPSKEAVNTSNNNEKGMTTSTSNSSLKSEQQAAPISQVEELRSKSPPLPSDASKDVKENKKTENKKSSLLALVTGRKETPKPAEVENIVGVSSKTEQPKATNRQQPPEVSSKKSSLNPFEEDMVEKKPEPLPADRNAKTSAVKPSLDVSSEAETEARLSSSSNNTFFAASFFGGQDTSPKSALLESSSLYSTRPVNESPSSPKSPVYLNIDSTSEEPKESSTDTEKPSLPVFWRSLSSSSNKPSEPKEVNVVTPFSEKNKTKKTYVKSLLDQITGKSASKNEENVVDENLVRGVFPVQHTSSLYEDSDSFPERNVYTAKDGVATPQNHDGGQPVSPDESKDEYQSSVKDVPKPTPRMQSAPKKEEAEEIKPLPPKPAPRSGKLNKASDSEFTVSVPQHVERSSSDSIMENASRVGATPVDSQVHSGQVMTKGTTSLFIEDFSYRLDELPVIPENPEGLSDDEQLDVKNDLAPAETKPKAHKENDTIESRVNPEPLYSPEHGKEKLSDTSSSEEKAKVETSDSTHQDLPEMFTSNTSSSSSPSLISASLPNDHSNTSRTESSINPTVDVSNEMESTGKKKLLRAWVSPSETHPMPTVQSGGAVSSRQRTNPVKPLNSTQTKQISSFPQPIKGHENGMNAFNPKKYDASNPAVAYAQLTHDELIQLVLKQKEIISRKDAQVRELEDYLDDLLVRVMEETPNILRSSAQLSKKAGRI